MSEMDVDPGYLTKGNIEAKTAKWMNELRQYCRAKKRFEFFPEKSALIVVDAQGYFFDRESHAYISASEALVPNITWLVRTFRKHGRPVIFTRHSLDDFENAGIMGMWWGDVIRESNPLAQVTHDLKPKETDIVIRKNRYSAFKNTGLEEILREKKVTNLVIAGVLTHLCVETTAREAFMNDFEVRIVVDGTASETEKLHMSSLRTMASGFAIPVTADEILSSFGGNG